MNTNKVSKMILLQIPTSICNFRCHYCYLAQRDICFQGKQAKMQYSPEQVALALSPKRMGGICFINACAEGETLLTKDIDIYFKALVEEGHYLEIVTNMTITPMINKILSWDKSLLCRVEFKCSFHYIELKNKNLLQVFATNVNNAWKAGASCNIEITPSDELIPYIEEVKQFSLENFGALPHLTIARDDRTKEIQYLTKLTEKEYEKTWSVFDSDFWRFKRSIFGEKRNEFCYAGLWSVTVNISTGMARKCYYETIGNIFDSLDKPIPFSPIGQCPIAHCYNGHAFMTFGLIPNITKIRYGDIRNRVRADGTEWLQPELKTFFNSTLFETNKEYGTFKKSVFLFKKSKLKPLYSKIKRIARRVIKGKQ